MPFITSFSSNRHQISLIANERSICCLSQCGKLGLPSNFFDEMLLNKLDSIDWKSFKVFDLT